MTPNDPYIVVEETNIHDVIPDLLEVLKATRDNNPDIKRFHWLYLENPDGPAVVWTLRRRESAEILGFTACLPRRVIVGGERRLCWLGADFSILPKYRSLGLALRLRRVAKEEIDQGRADFLYSHPNDRMAVIHEKVGHKRVGTMIRLARIISVRPFLEERRQTKLVAGIASKILDPVLHATSSEWRTASLGKVIAAEELFFGPEFDDLFESEQDCRGIVGVRDALYLNWRYADNPLEDYRLLTLREGATLRGYLIYAINTTDNGIYIKDIFPARPAAVVQSLLKELWKIGNFGRCRSISITLLESNPILGMLKTFHYGLRPETSQMYTHAPQNSHMSDIVNASEAWYITAGDRDI